MINITLPDGTKRQYKKPCLGIEIAETIRPKLAKEAVAIKVDDVIKDLRLKIDQDCKIEIITK